MEKKNSYVKSILDSENMKTFHNGYSIFFLRKIYFEKLIQEDFQNFFWNVKKINASVSRNQIFEHCCPLS